MGDEDTKNHANNSPEEVDRAKDLEMQTLISEEHNSEPNIVEHQSPSIVENNVDEVEPHGEEYSCSPPKWFIPTIIILQILFFFLA